MPTDNAATPLLMVWADLDSAAQEMLVAMPRQVTQAAERLDAQRLAMRAALQAYAQAPAPGDVQVTFLALVASLTPADIAALQWLPRTGSINRLDGGRRAPAVETLRHLADFVVGDPVAQVSMLARLCWPDVGSDRPKEFDEHWSITPLGARVVLHLDTMETSR